MKFVKRPCGTRTNERWTKKLELTVMEPEEKTNCATEDQRTTKKPSCFRHSNNSHNECSNYNYQSNWMPSEQASAVSPERHNFVWMWVQHCVRVFPTLRN